MGGPSPRGHYHRLMCLSGFHGKSPLGRALCSVEGDRDERRVAGFFRRLLVLT